MNIELVHAVNNGVMKLEEAEAKQAEIDKAKAEAAKAVKKPAPTVKKGEQAK